jgi:glycosyltransferase involved in cell wall biosynthesis
MPVIVSDVGGITEMVTDGENGIVCEPHSVGALVDAVRRFEMSDYVRLARNAWHSFDDYDDNRVNANVIAELKSCVNT